VIGRVLQQSGATIHLRKPGQTVRRIADYLRQVPVSYHPRIMVHGHSGLLDHFDLMGVHFTEKERARNLQRLRQLRLDRPGCLLSSAFHRIADIPEYDGLLDYILLSPIFDSISKQGYRAAFDHAELRRFLSGTPHCVIALGGVDAKQAATAASLGFEGIAVLGAVWQAGSPERAAGQLSNVCAELTRLKSTAGR